MTVDEAFKAGLQAVRDLGLPAKGTDPAVIVASRYFHKDCGGKDTNDPRFPKDGPEHAKRLILQCYSL